MRLLEMDSVETRMGKKTIELYNVSNDMVIMLLKDFTIRFFEISVSESLDRMVVENLPC